MYLFASISRMLVLHPIPRKVFCNEISSRLSIQVEGGGSSNWVPKRTKSFAFPGARGRGLSIHNSRHGKLTLMWSEFVVAGFWLSLSLFLYSTTQSLLISLSRCDLAETKGWKSIKGSSQNGNQYCCTEALRLFLKRKETIWWEQWRTHDVFDSVFSGIS